jgi:alpha-2-macroglobulin
LHIPNATYSHCQAQSETADFIPPARLPNGADNATLQREFFFAGGTAMRGLWRRTLAAVCFCLFTIAAAQGLSAAPFDSLKTDATNYLDGLRKAAPPDPKGDARKLAARKAEHDGEAALKAGDPAKAISFFEQALALGVPPFNSALKLSEAWATRTPPAPDRALHAAYMAVLNAPNIGAAGAAWWRIADLYDRQNAPRQARDALLSLARKVKDDPQGDKALLLTQREGLPARLLETRRKLGLSVTGLRAESDGERPRLCLSFDEPLFTGAKIRFEDFVALTPPPGELIADAEASRLCLSGVRHGMIYKVAVRPGIPAMDGVTLKEGFTSEVVIPDRAPSLAFRGAGRILPRVGSEGVPFTAVNVERVAVKIYRINDRGLVPYLRERYMGDTTGSAEADYIADNHGELTWKGEMSVPTTPNKEVVAAIPFAHAVPKPQPGYYAVVIDALGVSENQKSWEKAAQWLQVTDIGLTAMRGEDGMNVFARSLSAALPMPGVTLALVARNNEELARVAADAQGRATFPPGLFKAEGGRTPYAVMAYAGDDFVSLDITQPGFDLSDRGVGGRPQPGPLDAYVYADRGVYRQGETVNLTALLRDDLTQGVEGFPLTVKVLRPNGNEYFSKTVPTAPGGVVTLAVPLSATAPLGGWRVSVLADPNRPPVGSGRFLVEDFVPERLAVELESSAPWLGEDEVAFSLTTRARFLYGAPAAGLAGTAEMRVEADPAPFPGYADYAFGVPGENLPGEAENLVFEDTDAQGVSTLAVDLGQLPDVSVPLRAKFSIAVMEPGGRPAKASAVYPIRRQPVALGLKLDNNAARLKEGEKLRFIAVALGRDGKPKARGSVNWRLIRERADFQWFFENGRYQYKAVRNDEPMADGRIAIPAVAPVFVDVAAPGGRTLPVGRYRLEIADGEHAAAASAKRFVVGWEPPEDPADTPDALEVTVDKPAYRAGEAAQIRITPPFAGQLMLTVATDRLHHVLNMAIPAEGTTVKVPVDALRWGPGAYVTATVYRPPQQGKDRQPVRAVGLAWVAVDPAERTLKVDLSAKVDLASPARPRGPQTVTVKVVGDDGKPPAEATYLTLAAVDEGILRLTRFNSPNPARHFFGKRALGVDIRDDYGRLIQPFDGPLGTLRQGGDSSDAGLPALPFKMVSLFQGPIKLDADGAAQVTYNLPDFNGELRLMAVAFSGKRLGSASQPLTVRDPMTAEAYLPRFLAPGDTARAAITLHNIEAAAGRYAVNLTGADGLSVANGAFEATLKPGQRETFAVNLTAGDGTGVGHATLKVAGPAGFAVERGYDLTVRSPRPVERTASAGKLEPGQELKLSKADLAAYRPDSAALSAGFSAVAPFDVTGTLRALYRYPYGCVEQTVSTALPLLAVERLEKTLGAPKPDVAAADRVQQAISSLLDRQRYDGSFSRWGGSDADAQEWLTAYVAEFLVRAKQAGRFVPDAPLRELLKHLEGVTLDGGTEAADLAARAYGLHVLTLAGGGQSAGAARYFHDAYLDKLPTALAKAQVGAALARFGDRMRAEHAFEKAAAGLNRKYWAQDYGSSVRDAAAIIRLAEEVGMLAPYLDRLLARLPANDTAAHRTTTQEQAWLLLAADALAGKEGRPGLQLAVTGATLKGRDPAGVSPDAAQLAAGVRVVNNGPAPVWRTVSLSGVPLAPPAAREENMTLKRLFFDRQGKPLDPANLKQNSVFVVVLEGASSAGVDHEAMLTQPLPAGWEVDRALTNEDRGEGTTMPWLAELSQVAASQARDDRFNAAVDIPATEPKFRVAFTLRAVTPGSFELPGASVEDMYQPRFSARLGWGRATVEPAKGEPAR